MIYFIILLVIILVLLIKACLESDNDIPPIPNSKVMMKKRMKTYLQEQDRLAKMILEEESQHLGCYYQEGKLKKL